MKTVISELEKLIEIQRGIQTGEKFSGAPESCDVCGRPLDSEKYMIDGALKSSESWACMCPYCHYEVGAGVGWGDGQVYMKDADGEWLLVGGFPPEDIE